MKKHFLLLIIFMMCLTLNLAYSQDTASHNLTETTVTGIRFGSDKTVSQLSLSGKKIKETYFGQDIPVIFNFVSPSITFYSDGGNYGGYMYYRLRGIDQTRINTTLNGVPLNEPEDQGAYFSNYPDFSANISSVQIQRGVGTTSNGTSSFAGSINFESPNLLDSGYTRAEFGYGSFNSSRFSITSNTRLRNKTALYTRYSKIYSDGYRDHSGTNGNTLFLSGGYFGKKDIVKLTMFLGNTKNEMAWLPSTESDIALNRKNNPLSKNETDVFTQNLNILSYTHYFSNNKLVFNNTNFYNHLTGKYGVLFGDLYLYFLGSNYLGNISTLTYSNNKNSKLVLGANVSTYNRMHKNSIAPNDNSFLYRNTGYKNEQSTFIKYSYQYKKVLVYTDIQYRMVDFRYSGSVDVNSVQWNFLNPKIGLSYQLIQNLNMYAFLGRSYREPTRNDMFAGYDDIDASNKAEVGNLSRVKAEEVLNFESGFDYKTKTTSIQLNYYSMDFKNEIAPIGQLSMIGLPMRKNIDKSFRRGVEFAGFQKIGNLEVNLGASYNYAIIQNYFSDAENKTYNNITPLLTPKYIVNSGVSYQFKNVGVSVVHKYISNSFLANTNDKSAMLPSSNVINFSSKVKLSNHLSMIVSINNILNANYYNSGMVLGTSNAYFVAPMRNYFLTMLISL